MSEVTDVYFDSEDDDEVFDESTSVEVEEAGCEDSTKPRDLEGRRVINLGDRLTPKMLRRSCCG
ncbi:Protein of unknown function [Gryllus bimaculatus]|nr:Protein of unknown function [Gryllus bimaculatus]